MNDIHVNRYLDSAVLKPELTLKEVKDAIRHSIDYKTRTVCVRPCDIELAVEMCKGTDTDVSVVLGFPHGVIPGELKTEEAKNYIKKGVKEIDMVVNYSYVRSGEWKLVEEDIRAVSSVTKPANVLLKVIFETSMLKPDEIAKTTEIAIKANADYVKTSTGFNGGGATEEAVGIMVKTANGRIKVKASGGIRDAQSALKFIEMGAERLGVNSASIAALCDGAAVKDTSGGY